MPTTTPRAARLPYIVLGFGLFLTLLVARGLVALDEAKERASFDAATNRTREYFQRQINGYLVLLDGLRGLAAAELSLNREQFRAYVKALQLAERYPGVQGLGFASLVFRDGADRAVANLRKNTDASFGIWPETQRDRMCPVVYFEPANETNVSAIGYDLFEDAERRAILDQAIETSQATAAGGFVLPDKNGGSNPMGLLIASPAYRGGATSFAKNEPLGGAFGFIFCVFRLDEMFRAFSDSAIYPGLAFRVFAGKDLEATSQKPIRRFGDVALEPRFTATTLLTLADRSWTVVFVSGSKPKGIWAYGLHPWATLGGVGVALLLFGITLAQTRAKKAAAHHAEARRVAEASYRRLVEQSLVGIYVIQDDRFVYVNPRMAEIFGCSAEELISRPLLDFIAEESRSTTSENVRRRMQGEVESVRYTLRALRKDGQVIDVEVHGCRSEYNGAPSILGCLIDITDRKQAERKVQGQLARLDLLSRITRAVGERQDLQSIFQVVVRSLEDHLPIDFGCVCQRDAAQETLTVSTVGVNNQRLMEELAVGSARIDVETNGLSGCIQGELTYAEDLGRSKFAFLQQLARAGLQSAVLAPIVVEKMVFGVLIAGRKQAHGFNSSDCEFLRQLSEHVGLATHQAQLYGALQHAYNDLRETKDAVMQQERLRTIGQMASGIAHDINNAITPVSVYAELLLRDETTLSSQGRDYLNTIVQSIDDVAATVGRLREVYRPQKEKVVFAPVDLNRQVERVLDLTKARWHTMAQERGVVIQVITTLAPNLPFIMGAESEIRQALTNLVLNAVDAMPSGGTLSLRTDCPPAADESDSQKFVHLEVSDTGCGMDEETKSRCLEPFFTTKGDRGTGLGLAMVFGIAERHSAEIEIESKVGVGTTFRLIIPVPSVALDSQSQAPAPPQAQPLRVLIVDDDPILLKSLQTVLESDGHSVVASASGQAGIDEFLAATARGGDKGFSLVITDLGMPEVDGRKVLAAVKKASPSTPVILLTGWGQRMVDSEAIPPGVFRVLSKPPRLHELREALLASACSPNGLVSDAPETSGTDR